MDRPRELSRTLLVTAALGTLASGCGVAAHGSDAVLRRASAVTITLTVSKTPASLFHVGEPVTLAYRVSFR